MKRENLDRNILKVEKFLDAASEADLGAMLAGMGISGERLTELESKLQAVKAARLQSDLQLGRQKDLTVRKDQQKQTLQNEVRRLSDLIRSHYPGASWLSSLGLETRYRTVSPQPSNEAAANGETVTSESVTPRRVAVKRTTSEAEFRGRCYQLMENIDDVEALNAAMESVGAFPLAQVADFQGKPFLPHVLGVQVFLQVFRSDHPIEDAHAATV